VESIYDVVFLSPVDDTLFIRNKGSIFECHKTLKDLIEDDEIDTLDLNHFKRYEVVTTLNKEFKVTLVDDIVFFRQPEVPYIVLGAFNLASKSITV